MGKIYPLVSYVPIWSSWSELVRQKLSTAGRADSNEHINNKAKICPLSPPVPPPWWIEVSKDTNLWLQYGFLRFQPILLSGPLDGCIWMKKWNMQFPSWSFCCIYCSNFGSKQTLFSNFVTKTCLWYIRSLIFDLWSLVFGRLWLVSWRRLWIWVCLTGGFELFI